jgi:pilus assembly protein CpaB
MHAAPIARVTFPVVVAERRLRAGEPIVADALRIERLPVRPGGTFAEPVLLGGRVPLADIEPGAPVFDAQLSSGFAELIEPGERAVAVHVDEASAVGDRMRSGNFVDVFFTLKRDSGGIGGQSEILRTQARLLLSRVRVLAFGDTLPAGGKPDEGTVHARTAVLAVPTADVDRLVLADSVGHLLLALRNPRDAEVVDQAFAPLIASAPASVRSLRAKPTSSSLAAAGISLSTLSGSEGGQATAPSRRMGSGKGQIEVIRGGRVATQAY